MSTNSSLSPDVPAVQFVNISKTFSGQKALDQVTFEVPRGKVTALLGMNGSGKSTLIKIMAGVHQPDPGSAMTVHGREVPFPLTPQRSHETKFRFLHQDVGLVPALTIADNFAFVDHFPTSKITHGIQTRRHYEHVSRTLELLDIHEHPGRLIADLDPATQTMIGIARALQDSDGAAGIAETILVLDEPTASLPLHEVDRVLNLVERIRDQGGTTIYVSHRTDEVERIADHLIILRDGKLVEDQPTAGKSSHEIVTLVVGKRIQKEPRTRTGANFDHTILSASGLAGPKLQNLQLELGRGEILGITGLVGCGRSELIRILSGAETPAAGTMTVDRQPFAPKSPADALSRGIAYVPQDRRRGGIVLNMSVGENMTLGRLGRFVRNGWIQQTNERASVRTLITEYGVKTSSLTTPIRLLSGGNQQKVVVARAASSAPRVLLMDEPTQGVDALAKEDIYRIIRSMAAAGTGVIVASTDFEEFIGLCDRVLVLNRGQHVATLRGQEITEERLALACSETDAPGEREHRDPLIQA